MILVARLRILRQRPEETLRKNAKVINGWDFPYTLAHKLTGVNRACKPKLKRRHKS
jgi:hypothetical protein